FLGGDHFFTGRGKGGRFMFFTPVNILGMWVRGVSSVAALGTGVYLLRQWYRHRPVHEEDRSTRRLPGHQGDPLPAPPPARVDARRPGRLSATPALLGGLG